MQCFMYKSVVKMPLAVQRMFESRDGIFANTTADEAPRRRAQSWGSRRRESVISVAHTPRRSLFESVFTQI